MNNWPTKCCRRIDVFKSLHGIVDTDLSSVVIRRLSLEFHEDPSSEMLLVLSHLLLAQDATEKGLKLSRLL